MNCFIGNGLFCTVKSLIVGAALRRDLIGNRGVNPLLRASRPVIDIAISLYPESNAIHAS